MSEHIVISLSAICLVALLCQWFAWRVKLPAILPLLLAGIVAGPVTGWLNPNELFGDLLFPFVSLAVAVILFEGALTLKLDEIRGLQRVVQNMVTIGLGITWLVTTVATHYIVGFPWELATLFGALTVVTGPTVIVPMLRTVRPTAKIANILRWEGIVIDPIGALLAVLVFEFIVSGQSEAALGHTFIAFFQIIIIGLAIGAASGYAFGIVLRNHWLPEYLHDIGTLAFVLSVYTLSNVLHEESGLLTVTVMGMWLANMRNVPIDDILDFKESLSVLLISGLFIILAARIEFVQFEQLGWTAVGILLAMQFIARPAKIALSTLGSNLNWRERAMLAWIAPRGIVAAAIAALFAIRLEEKGMQQAELLVPLTFLIIIGTVVLQGTTSRWLAQRLGVGEPDPKGFLIIGANLVARKIAAALTENGFRASLADSNWENIKTARMQGLKTYYGNPISEHADRHLDLVGIGRMLGLSTQPDLNVLANLRYRSEFGRNAVYALQSAVEKDANEKHKVASHHRGYVLFDHEITYAKLASLFSKDAEIRSTPLTVNFSFEEYKKKHAKSAIPLFAIDPHDNIQVFVADGKLRPEAGWTVLSLVTPQSQTGTGDNNNDKHKT